MNLRSLNWLRTVAIALVFAIAWAGYLLNVPMLWIILGTIIALVTATYFTRQTTSHPPNGESVHRENTGDH